MSMEVTSNNRLSNRTKDFPENRRVFIVAVPKYHDNLYRHIVDYHEWLTGENAVEVKTSAAGFRTSPSTIQHWVKVINQKYDFQKLERLIRDLREEKSELFLDDSYYPKPKGVSIKSFINEFIKSKGIANHYTFNSYYRISVFPFNVTDTSKYPEITGEDPITNEPIYAPDERNEYLIIPLLIRLKKGKTYEQNKVLSYVQNEDGSWGYKINNINRFHFKKDPEPPTLSEIEAKKKYGWVIDDNPEENNEL